MANQKKKSEIKGKKREKEQILKKTEDLMVAPPFDEDDYDKSKVKRKTQKKDGN